MAAILSTGFASRAARGFATGCDRLAAKAGSRGGPLQRAARTAGAASCVSDPIRFAMREARGSGRGAVYRLAGREERVAVRHPLLDMWVLEEVFRFDAYTFPAVARERLERLQTPIRVLDLGGHIGLFGLHVLGCFPAARIVSFEPDPRNAATLHRCIEANGRGGTWRVVEAAASTGDGRLEFVSDFHLSGAAADVAVEADVAQLLKPFPFLARSELARPLRIVVDRRDVFALGERFDLLKIDVEGGEWELLGDDRLGELGASVVVVEYHPAGCPSGEPLAAATAALEGAGYETGHVVEGHGGEGTLWAWR